MLEGSRPTIPIRLRRIMYSGAQKVSDGQTNTDTEQAADDTTEAALLPFDDRSVVTKTKHETMTNSLYDVGGYEAGESMLLCVDRHKSSPCAIHPGGYVVLNTMTGHQQRKRTRGLNV